MQAFKGNLKKLNLKLKFFVMKIWHETDMKFAHYHVEACDNAKYLGTTEKYSHAIYLEVSLLEL